MSVAALVPMISPDGRSGDIPAERVSDAVSAGFKPATVMTAPDGKTTGYIPHDRAAEAMKAGFKVGPASQQDLPSPATAAAKELMPDKDTLADFGKDVWSTIKGAGHMILDPAKSPTDIPVTRMVKAYVDSVQASKQASDEAAAKGNTTESMIEVGAAGLPLVGPLVHGTYGKSAGVGASRIAQAASMAPEGIVIPNPAAAAVSALKTLPEAASKVADLSRTAVDTVKGAVPAAKAGVGKTAGFLSDVIDPEITGIISPRLAHVQRSLGRLADVLEKNRAATTETPTASPSQAAESEFPEAGALEPEVVHDVDPVTSAPQKITAILKTAEAQVKSLLSDKVEDRAVSQEMNWDMEKQGYRALSEERQKYFADNAPIQGKSQLATQAKVTFILEKAQAEAKAVLEQARISAEVPARYTKTRPPKDPAPSSSPVAAQSFEDMTDVLQRSIDAVKRKKGVGQGN